MKVLLPLRSGITRVSGRLANVLRRAWPAVRKGLSGLGRSRRFLHRLRPILHSVRILRRVPRIESLKLKLTLGATALALLILLLTFITLNYTSRDAAGREAERQAEQLGSFFAGALAESVAAGDRMQVHLLSQALLDIGVHAILVTGKGGKVLYASRPGLSDGALNESEDLKPVSGGILGTVAADGRTCLQASQTIRFGDTPVGVLNLWFDRSGLEKRIQEANAFIYPIFAFGFLLMFLLGFGILSTPFRALKRLTVEAERIGSGDLSVRVPVEGRDEVANFCESFNSMVDGLCQARAEISRKHLETIQAMIGAVEAKDSYTQGHCLRVKSYASKILDRVTDLSPELRTRIETAALLHDIGKIGIPDRVLLKTQQLTKKELEIIRTHVIIGENILAHIDSMKDIARWIRHHHESYDGYGYPDGLRGDSIPLASRVITVADTIDAMLTDRPYRKALSRRAAIKTLREGKGSQYDPAIVDCAVAALEELGGSRSPATSDAGTKTVEVPA